MALTLCPDPSPGDYLRMITAEDYVPPCWLNASDAEPKAEDRRKRFRIIPGTDGPTTEEGN
jgi:hypothetical protein